MLIFTHDGQDLSRTNQAVDILEDASVSCAHGNASKGEIDGQRAMVCDEAWEVYC